MCTFATFSHACIKKMISYILSNVNTFVCLFIHLLFPTLHVIMYFFPVCDFVLWLVCNQAPVVVGYFTDSLLVDVLDLLVSGLFLMFSFEIVCEVLQLIQADCGFSQLSTFHLPRFE